MTLDGLAELLEVSRRKNAELGISGMLLYKDLSFLQVIEGPHEAIRTLYQTIRVDDRHGRVRVLFEEPVAAREFADWSMGFQNLDGEDLSTFDGYTDLMQSGDSARRFFEHPTRAKRLLMQFRALS
jgi:hypothetical protein